MLDEDQVDRHLVFLTGDVGNACKEALVVGFGVEVVAKVAEIQFEGRVGNDVIEGAQFLTHAVVGRQQGIALDQIEILFDPELQIDPFRFIRTLSHSQLILLSWPGTCDPSRLIYARPGHPEYRVSPIGDTLIYSLENAV